MVKVIFIEGLPPRQTSFFPLKFPLCPAGTIKATLSLVKSRLALGSTGWLARGLVVTMPKMAEYTGKWLLPAP